MLRWLLGQASCCSHSGLQQQNCSVRAAAAAPINSLSQQRQPRHRASAVTAAAGTDSTSGSAAESAPPERRRRRKLFTTSTQSPEDVQQSPQLSTADAVDAQSQQRPPRQRRQQQQQEGKGQRQTQQRQGDAEEHMEKAGGWWERPAAASELLLHCFWDLDNLKPDHWDQAEQLVGLLKSELRPLGRLQQLQAYANSHTLVRRVDTEGIEDLVEEQDENRCPICGRRCKSFDDLQKHFKQLHEREHKKKMGAPKKFANKYAKSDKAARVRDAGRLYGTPKKNRSGRRGQMVKVLLQRAGLKVIEVASQGQAADDAINRHMGALIEQLAATDPKPPSASRPAAAAANGAGEDNPPALWSHLTSAQACLDELLKMDEEDLRVAWKYLKQTGAVPDKRLSWNKLWIKIEKARRAGDGRAPKAPEWLSYGWDKYHGTVAEGAQSTPWSSNSSVLQQSVLVLISDDRGFASSIARWVRSGAAGVLLVTTRGSNGWEQPLQRAFGSQKWPRHAVRFLSWDDITSELDPVFAGADGWDSEDEEWGGLGYGGGYELGSYEWMVSEGLL